MADRKITELAALSAGGQATGDLLTIVDVSEAAAADKNKKITVENLFKGIPGDVGIGTSSPQGELHLNATDSNGFLRVTNTTTGSTSSDGALFQMNGNDLNINNLESGNLVFHTADSPAMRIDSSGRIGIGTTPTQQILTIDVNDSGTTPASFNGINIANTDTTANNGSAITFGQTIAGNSNARIGVIQTARGPSESQEMFFGLLGSGTYSERLRIASDGLTTVTGGVHVTGDATPTSGKGVEIFRVSDTLSQIQTYNRDDSAWMDLVIKGKTQQFYANGSEAMKLNSSGQLGIGTASPEDPLHIKSNSGAIRLENTVVSNNDSIISYDNATLLFQCDVNNVRGDSTILFKSDDQDRLTIDGNGDVGIGTTSPQGELHLHARDTNGFLRITNTTTGSTSADGALFQMNGNDLNINNLESGSFIFHTADSPAMRIDSNQRVLINKTGPQSTEIFGFTFGAGSQGCNSVVGVTSTQYHFVFTNPNGAVGSIYTNGSATGFATSSDYRLKENVVDLDDAITRVKQLSPKRFNFIADAETTFDGFLAHEAQTVVPEAVTGTHNEVDDDGNAVMQNIDQSKLVPLLTAALKEAIAKIETLETKVAALEAQ
jgi:hypothetical protein